MQSLVPMIAEDIVDAVLFFEKRLQKRTVTQVADSPRQFRRGDSRCTHALF